MRFWAKQVGGFPASSFMLSDKLESLAIVLGVKTCVQSVVQYVILADMEAGQCHRHESP